MKKAQSAETAKKQRMRRVKENLNIAKNAKNAMTAKKRRL